MFGRKLRVGAALTGALVAVIVAAGLATALHTTRPDDARSKVVQPKSAQASPSMNATAEAAATQTALTECFDSLTPVPTPTPHDIVNVSPLFVGVGVLHIESVETVRSAQGQAVSRSSIEFWYDRRNGDVRFERQRVLGSAVTDLILLDDGNKFTRYIPVLREGGLGYSRTISADDSGIPRPVEVMFQLKTQVVQHKASSTVNVTPPNGWVSIGSGPRIKQGDWIGYVDRVSGLTQRVDNLDVPRGGKIKYEYDVVEIVMRSSLPQDFFNIESLPQLPPAPEPRTGPYPTEALPFPTSDKSP